MKILILNGSPRARGSNTDRLLAPFAEGASSQGAEITMRYVAEMNIRDCQGCFGCWVATPGQCHILDDMPALIEEILNADSVVWASPLYHFGITASLKRVMERTLPLAQPEIVDDGKGCHHPSRYEGRDPRWLWVMNCEFPDVQHYDAVKAHMLALDSTRRTSEPTQAILCTAGEVLRASEAAPLWGEYLAHVRQCGVEFVRDGRISETTLTAACTPFIDIPTFCKAANQSWAQQKEMHGRKADQH